MTTRSITLKPLTFGEIPPDEKALYILNRTVPTGPISFAVHSNGKIVTVKIPNTKVPIDITQYVPRKDILADINFMNQVRRGNVIVISMDDALEIYANDPAATKELRRVFELNSVGRDAQGNIEYYYNSAPNNSMPQPTINPPTAMNPDTAGMFVVGIHGRLMNGEDAADCLADLQIREHTLKKADVQYIMENVTDETIKNWAASLTVPN